MCTVAVGSSLSVDDVAYRMYLVSCAYVTVVPDPLCMTPVRVR